MSSCSVLLFQFCIIFLFCILYLYFAFLLLPTCRIKPDDDDEDDDDDDDDDNKQLCNDTIRQWVFNVQ